MTKSLSFKEVYDRAELVDCDAKMVSFLQETVPHLAHGQPIENLDVWSYISALSGVLEERQSSNEISHSELCKAIVRALYYE